jgi:hypothetical protein
MELARHPVDTLLRGNLPAAHDITIAAKNLRQAAHDNICMWQYRDIEKVSNRLINHNSKTILICQFPYAKQIWTLEEWVRGEFAEQAEDLLAGFQSLFQVVEILLGAVAVEMTAVWRKLL